MDLALKNRLIRQYLKDVSNNAELVIGEAKLADFAGLGAALDYLEANAVGLLNFNTIEGDDQQKRMLKNILDTSSTFSVKNPPVLSSVSEAKLQSSVLFWRNELQLAALPRSDYFNRTTTATVSPELNDLVRASRLKMGALVKSFLTRESVFDPANDTHVKNITEQLQTRLKTLAKDSEPYQTLEKKIKILDDLNKINKLAVMTIPDESEGPTDYCSLAESAGGVTEKVSLIKLSKVLEQLTNLSQAVDDVSTVDKYTAARDNFKLSTQAILKLPKHKDIKEVQREAMALNISRMLGLETTRSSMMTHEGQPALFVPFSEIKLLKDYAKGKTFQAAGFSGQTYEHYSTINPVGRGLAANKFVDDFGASLGLFYLSSDTDAVGGYNQNKALIGDQHLFIFDQVIMGSDKLGLDSRMSLQPTQTILKHTRHGQGRNRTLIEDSSIDSKFASIMDLKAKESLLLQYTDRICYFHDLKIQDLNHQLEGSLDKATRKRIEAERDQIVVLRKDAADLKDVIHARIAKIEAVFPDRDPSISTNELKQSLVLEKLMNNPVLYSDSGRPFRNPWTHRNTNQVQTISDQGGTHVRLTFNEKIKDDLFNFIKRSGADSMVKTSDKSITISRADLALLRESMLHPEHQLAISHDKEYLDQRDLKVIGQAYGEGHQATIITAMDNYSRFMATAARADAKIDAMEKTEKYIFDRMKTATDAGFAMHVLKKFYLDVQQELQLMIPHERKPPNLDAAFVAAMKLDRIGEFNAVLKFAIQNDRLDSALLNDFLDDCILRAGQANNHQQAVTASTLLLTSANHAITELKKPVEMIELRSFREPVDEDVDELAAINPIAVREEELQREHRIVVAALNPDVRQASSEETVDNQSHITLTSHS